MKQNNFKSEYFLELINFKFEHFIFELFSILQDKTNQCQQTKEMADPNHSDQATSWASPPRIRYRRRVYNRRLKR
jgi:hypothetical protein